MPALGLGAAFAAAALGAACTDASHMFSGRWEASEPLAETWIAGRPELDLGHFGPEITGVIHYKDDLGVLDLDPPCAFLEGDSVDTDRKVFVATTEHDAATYIWTLTRVDPDQGDPYLQGTVELESGAKVEVTFDFVDTFVSDELKVCNAP